MTKQTIIVSGKKFATGLFWQPVTGGNTAYNYAKQIVKNIDVKYTMFVEYKSMIGLGNQFEGIRVGMPSIAASVAESLSEFISFLGVFQSGNNYYLIAVRNGIIVRDILFDNADEARKNYASLSTLPDWGGLFAPASWGMPRAQEKFLSDIIRTDNVFRLRNINVFKSITIIIACVCIFCSIMFVVLKNQINDISVSKKEIQNNPELIAEYNRQVDIKNQELDKQFEITKPIEYPFEKLPNVIERANLCYKAIAFVMQPINGWDQTYIKCGSDSVSATFKRDFGTLNDFYQQGAELMPGAIVKQTSDEEIIVSVKLPVLSSSYSRDERNVESALRDLTTNFQKIDIDAKINVVQETFSNNIDTEEINSIVVEASSKLIPKEFMQIFRDFNGVYINFVVWNPKTKMWTYNVVVYTK